MIRNLLAAVFICALGLYFRTDSLRGPSWFEVQSARGKARELIESRIRNQLLVSLNQAQPNLSHGEKMKLVDRALSEMVLQDAAGYEKTLTTMTQDFLRQRRPESSRPYLLGADSYYYYALTKNLIEDGVLGPHTRDGQFFNPVRHYPFGTWDWISFHPYVGQGVYKLLHALRPGISLEEAVGYVPLLLYIVIVAVFFGLCAMLRIPPAASVAGGLVLVSSPIFLERSVFGWYDTDPYSLIFPMLFLCTLFMALHRPRTAVPLGAAGGLATSLYSFFWPGWLLYFGLTVASSAAVTLLEAVLEKKERRFAALRYGLAYVPVTLLCLLLFKAAGGFAEEMRSILGFLPAIVGAKAWTEPQYQTLTDAQLPQWPNIMIMISEGRAMGLAEWRSVSLDPLLLIVALTGFVLTGWTRFKKERGVPFYEWAVVAVFFLPVFFMSFIARRFAVLGVLPLALFAAWGAAVIVGPLEARLARIRAARFLFPRPAVLAAAALLIPLLASASVSAQQTLLQFRPLMDDTWHNALTMLARESPADAVVVSWWPPGYFVLGKAERRVVVDGGSMHFPETYWIARALMARDEKTARGILRMLLVSGNKAVAFLSERGFDLARGVELILDVVPLERTEARLRLPEEWDAAARDAFLDLTHGRSAPVPAYVLVYQNLIQHNAILQLTAHWNFHKAEQVFRPGEAMRFSPVEYARRMTAVAGGLKPYLEPSIVLREEDGKIIFENGVVLEEPEMKAYYPVAETDGVKLEPMDVWYLEEGEWKFRPAAAAGKGGRERFTVILHRSGDNRVAVAAHTDIASTLLYRLYFLNGAGLKFFTPFDPAGREPSLEKTVRLYRVRWEDETAAPEIPAADSSLR